MWMAKKEALFKFNQETIAQVADELFRKQGIAQTTMDEIAQVADYSKTTIYTYFKSKDEIIYYLGLQSFSVLAEKIGDVAVAGGSVVTAYSKYWWLVADYQADNDLYYDWVMGVTAFDVAKLEANATLQAIALLHAKIDRIVLNLLDKGAYEGVFRTDVNNVETLRFLWASLQGVLQYTSLTTGQLRLTDMSRQEFLTKSFDLTLRSILN